MTTPNDLFPTEVDTRSVLDPELRLELMKISTMLKTTAAAIDEITQRKGRAKTPDVNGEPNWRFGAKVPIPSDFYATKRMVSYARDFGFSQDATTEMFAAFVRFYAKNGRKWADWSRVWMDWVRREKTRQAEGGGKRVTSDGLQKW